VLKHVLSDRRNFFGDPHSLIEFQSLLDKRKARRITSRRWRFPRKADPLWLRGLPHDYEGIGGREAHRGDLVPMYQLTVSVADGSLVALDVAPFQIRYFRLNRVDHADEQAGSAQIDAQATEEIWLCARQAGHR
jgi:hypothetical protein